ncbi:hypothetical protein Tco_0926345 [Tanacetum coccineum]|uniref:Uncharacterized protein n=1 Tax=Tanacetum coccineum TaxID=301880 RepID=A0ABQ5DCH3_9ASTR
MITFDTQNLWFEDDNRLGVFYRQWVGKDEERVAVYGDFADFKKKVNSLKLRFLHNAEKEDIKQGSPEGFFAKWVDFDDSNTYPTEQDLLFRISYLQQHYVLNLDREIVASTRERDLMAFLQSDEIWGPFYHGPVEDRVASRQTLADKTTTFGTFTEDKGKLTLSILFLLHHDNQVPPEAIAKAHAAWVKGQKEDFAVLMYVEKFHTLRAEEGQSVSSHVLEDEATLTTLEQLLQTKTSSTPKKDNPAKDAICTNVVKLGTGNRKLSRYLRRV